MPGRVWGAWKFRIPTSTLCASIQVCLATGRALCVCFSHAPHQNHVSQQSESPKTFTGESNYRILGIVVQKNVVIFLSSTDELNGL